MSDANRAKFSYVKESTWGQTPATALKDFRLTSDSLSQATDTTQSAEIRSDRQVADIIRTAFRAQGGVNWELSYGAPDDLLEGWFMNIWSTALAISGTLSASATGNKFTSDTGVGGPSLAAVQVGQWIKTAGFVNSANNGYFKVTAKNTGGTVHELTVVGGTLVTETGSGDETIKGSVLFPGTTFTSFSIEKAFEDVAKFDSFVGMVVAQFGLEVRAGAIVTGSFGFLGQKGAASQTATIGTGPNVAAPTNPVMNAIDHVAELYEANTPVTIDVSSFTLQGDNNLRARAAIRNAAPIGIGLGLMSVTGTLEAYFEDRALLDKYRAFTETSLALRFVDSAGNAYVLDVEGVKLTGGEVLIPGQSQDVMAAFTFGAKVGGTSGKQISINRFTA